MNLGSHLTEAVRPVFDLVYPPRCPVCGDALAAQGGLCVECFSGIEVPGQPACTTCQRPIGGAVGRDEQCYVCKREPPQHDGVIAATLYNDLSRQLVLNFKHGGKIALAPLLGQLIAARIDTPDAAKVPLLIPVPLHRWRIWRRGYNQAALLAREIARRGKGELLVDGLVRLHHTQSLGGLGRDARQQVLSGAIGVRRGARRPIAGHDVVLVDDVLTSGATSDACVAALKEAGAASVRIACFARAVDGAG